jgi:TonB family protein
MKMRGMIFRHSTLWIPVVLLTLTGPCYSAISSNASDALLRGDWNTLLVILEADSTSMDDPVTKHLLAHAYVATGRSLVSDSLFKSIKEQGKRRWLEWTDSLELEYPSNYVAAYLSADATWRIGRWAEAISGFSRAMRLLRDGFALVSMARGAAWAEKSRDSAAIADFTVALEANPEDIMISFNRGKSYIHAGRYDEAISDFNTVLRLNRKYVPARYYKAVALDKALRIDEAIDAYQALVKNTSPLDTAYVALANESIARLLAYEPPSDSGTVDSASLSVDSLAFAGREDGMAVRVDSVEFLNIRGGTMAFDVMPKPISVPEVKYPKDAEKAGVTGVVRIKALVSEEGKVANAIIENVSKVDSSLQEAAKKAAMDGKWEPATQGGKATPSWVSYSVEFTADGKVENRIPDAAEASVHSDSAEVTVDPQAIFVPEPEYPDSAREAGIVGAVRLRVLVDPLGDVRDAQVLRESGKNIGFESAAKEAAMKGKWRPATKAGAPATCWVHYEVEFTSELAARQVERDAKLEAAVDSVPAVAYDLAMETDSSDFVRVQELPEALSLAKPDFPETARDSGMAADVWVKVLIGVDGSVRDGSVIRSSVEGMGFEEAALEAAMKGKWKPAVQDSNPVECWVSYRIPFEPGGEQAEGQIVLPDTLSQSDQEKADAEVDTTAGESAPPERKHGIVDQMPVPIKIPETDFPAAAADSGATGTVSVTVLISRNGTVREATVEMESGIDVGFIEAARAAAMKGEWKPATAKGRPMPFKASYSVEFTSEGKAVNHLPEVDEASSQPDAGAETEVFPAPDDSVAVDVEPKLISLPEPGYPEAARKEGLEGVVWVRSLVDREGRVREVMIEKRAEANVGFEEAAMSAAKGALWRPARRGGQPVPYWVSHKIEFKKE